MASVVTGQAQGFLTSNGLLTQNYSKLNAELIFDYDQLARWLLKISFNSTRTDRGHSHLFERFIPYSLNGAPAPSKADFAIVSTLAAPLSIKQLKGDYEALQSLADQNGRVNPFFMRIAYGPATYSTFTLRVVMFGPLTFFLLMYLPGVPTGSIANETKRLLKDIAGLILLQPGSTKAFLKAGPASWLDYYAPQIMRVKKLGAYHP